jgi:hypothetical protein
MLQTGLILALRMMMIQRIAAVRKTCLCPSSRRRGKKNSRVSMPKLEASNSKAMMLELGALVDMKPMRGIQTTMLNTARIMAGILVSMLIIWLENSMPHMEESKVVGMFIHMEGSMVVDTSMLRQHHME